jgi:hydrogenase maturation protease
MKGHSEPGPVGAAAGAARAAWILVLGTGNEILGDDAVGLEAARLLENRFGEGVDVVRTEEAGLSLLDFLAGYDRVLILDAIRSGRPHGSIIEADLEELAGADAPCRHHLSLPEVAALGRRIGLEMPRRIRVLALEVPDPYSVFAGLTPATAAALPRLVERAEKIVRSWLGPCRAPSEEKAGLREQAD